MQTQIHQNGDSYRIKTSHGALQPALPVLYYFEIEMKPGFPDVFQHVLPSVHMDMIFPVSNWIGIEGHGPARSDAFISPILRTGKKLVFSRNCKLFGIRFDPIYVDRLFAGSVKELIQGPNDLAGCLKKPLVKRIRKIVADNSDFGSRFRELDTLIRKHCELGWDPQKSICTFALERIRSNPHLKVRDLSRLTGYSARWLERLFIENIGTTPQEIIRITRFNRFLSLLKKDDISSLTSLVFECGYYDQSHLIRDFRSFAPATPSEFHRDLPLLSNVFNHV
jgi:AraC-like DNA-binding protein